MLHRTQGPDGTAGNGRAVHSAGRGGAAAAARRNGHPFLRPRPAAGISRTAGGGHAQHPRHRRAARGAGVYRAAWCAGHRCARAGAHAAVLRRRARHSRCRRLRRFRAGRAGGYRHAEHPRLCLGRGRGCAVRGLRHRHPRGRTLCAADARSAGHGRAGRGAVQLCVLQYGG